MNEQEYIKDRVDDQIIWYDKKSKYYKKLFTWTYFLDVSLSASIPLLTLFSNFNTSVKYLIAIIATVITILSAVSATFKLRKNWIEYRTTAETLKHEKYLYLTKTTPYDSEKSFDVFVQNIESLISTENTNWAYYIQKNIKDGDKNNG